MTPLRISINVREHKRYSFTLTNGKPPDAIYNRILAVFESSAILLEGSEEAVNQLLLEMDLSALTPDQRVALQNWHKGIQQAVTAIRCPE